MSLLRGSTNAAPISALCDTDSTLGMAGAVPGQDQAGDHGKVLPQRVLALPRLPGNEHSPKADRAPGAFGQRSRDAQGGIVGVSVQGQKLDWMIMEAPFLVRLFCDSESGSGRVNIWQLAKVSSPLV
ncbi:hypothetical protein DUI87_14577 [Hirundo rustica rustica]|uniref:Uncharacterized protein n=1 Tax=Hirundo rustica rustica TaxID=333673 RepID=A0A3M0K560_HIRRU|nr:hypothetical protein DUI87_14577 [Hirundo rustica rustica]